MNAKIALAAAVIIGYALPAAADSYWVVRDTEAKKCSIVSEKPTTTKMTVVNPDGTTYTTKTEAESAMKTIKVCNEM